MGDKSIFSVDYSTLFLKDFFFTSYPLIHSPNNEGGFNFRKFFYYNIIGGAPSQKSQNKNICVGFKGTLPKLPRVEKMLSP